MKIKQGEVGFKPIKLTLETKEEAEAFFDLLLCSSPQNDEQWKIMRWAESLDWATCVLGGCKDC